MTDVEELRKKAIEKAKQEMGEELKRKDKIIVHAVKTIDTIDKTSNLLAEQLRNWYVAFFPEAELDDIDELLKAVGIAERDDEDVEMMLSYGEKIAALRNERMEIKQYLNKLMEEEAPNISAIVGTTIGARLISTAGSLGKLAESSSSAVQVLGAEKALFAHLKKKKVPAPKHGIIFQYPAIRGAKKEDRGKISRKVAAKLSIAAKVDFFKGEFIGDRLAKELEKELSVIK